MKKDRLKTLYLDANATGPTVIKTDTILRGIFGFKDGATPPAFLRRYPMVVDMFAHLRQFHEYLSYVLDWRDAFCAAPELDVEVCNINNLVHYSRCLFMIRHYDLIIISHVAAGDDMTLLLKAVRWFQRRRGKLVVFIGNEYDLLDEKIGFIRSVQAEYICSQLPLEAASYLYQECDQSQLLSMPHALNPKVYYPITDSQRIIDIGFIGDIYWPFVGDKERTDLIRLFEIEGTNLGLTCDIRTQRIPRTEWATFLNTCKGIIGAESGTYYLNDRGRLLTAARDYNLNENRQATFEEVFERFYQNQPRLVSGKSISSRHFEPIGTKTCQVLLEGDYNGILKADEHYISVKKDLSNIDEVVRCFKDENYRQAMVERTYEYVLSNHTYHHRVQSLLKTIC
jgi:hypothetical protein